MSMQLKILLPHRVFLAQSGVKRIVVETNQGAFGILPNRLDGTAAVAPGIFTYETEAEGELYIAVDKGVLVKAGNEVLVSVRNAISGRELGQLHQAVAEEFMRIGEHEKEVRSVLVKMETRFMRQFQKLKQE